MPCRRAAVLLLAPLLAALAPHAADARTLRVAAAASVKPALVALARAFEAEERGVTVRVTAGASGAFVAQIRNEAPFDLFFSADREYPRELVAAGLGEGEVVYAIGRLALWTRADLKVTLARGPALLADAAVKKVAIANPAVAPWGRAAEAALRASGAWEAVKPKLVLGSSASQAAHFAASGAVDAALLPLALAAAPELSRGRFAPVPSGDGAALAHSATVLRTGEDAALARRFLAFVTGGKGRAILAQSGYALP